MFTQNYINFKKALFEMGSNNLLYISFIRPSGEQLTFINSSGIAAGELGTHMKNGLCKNIGTSGHDKTYFGTMDGIYFGSGTTPATKDDYTLESPITSGLSISSPTTLSYGNSSDGIHTCSAAFTIANTTDSDISISEVGLFTPINSTSGSYYSVLMERTVLTEPITIPSGGTKIVNYKITFNQ